MTRRRGRELLLLASLLTSSAFAAASPEEDAIRNAIRSTVQLIAYEAGTQNLASRASGVLVSPDGWLITNKHAVASAGGNFWDIEVRVTGANERPDPKCSYRVPAGNVAFSSSDDIALIIPQPKDVPCRPLPYLRPYGSLPTTITAIQALGYPATNIGGESLTVTAGQIAGRIQNPEGRDLFLKVDVLIGPGNSGGPIVDLEGHLLGISTAITEIALADGVVQKFVGLAVPSTNLLEAFPELPREEPAREIPTVLPPDIFPQDWYSGYVAAFTTQGYVDGFSAFRGADVATRSEFISLVINLLGGVATEGSEIQSFDDVTPSHPAFAAFEEGGKRGIVRGQGACYGTHPCFAHPESPINRAEAATLLLRAFNLRRSEFSPTFNDNLPNQWYTEGIDAASSLCVLRGDDARGTVRPADFMNRAEMIAMLYRVFENLRYPACTGSGEPIALPPAPSLDVETPLPNPPPKGEGMGEGALGPLPCTLNAWECVDIGPCTHDRTQLRKCTLVDSTCRNPERVKPPETHSCIPARSRLEEMRDTIEAGRALTVEMEDTAFTLPHTYADQVLQLKARFGETLDSYLAIYNAALRDSRWIKFQEKEIANLERELAALEEQFRSILEEARN